MNKTILIIEDELKIRFLLRDYLKSEGFNVLEASDGDEGIFVFKNNKIDLILLDIMMPKIDGITVLETIRTVSDLPIILLTAKGQEEVRVVLHLHPRLAPVQVAVLPLLKNKPQLVEKAKELEAKLRRHFLVDYDERGQIGKRYRRYDEIGTPCCLTVDFDTLEDDTVTVRDRDTMQQERIKIADLRQYLNDKLCMDMDF